MKGRLKRIDKDVSKLSYAAPTPRGVRHRRRLPKPISAVPELLRLSGFIEYARQHEAGGDARLQGDAGFEVTLRLAPQAAAVGKLSEVHQERCVVGFVFQPRIGKVDGFCWPRSLKKRTLSTKASKSSGRRFCG